MKKFILLNIGPSRSWTTSIYSTLSQPYQIAHLKEIEIFNLPDYENVINNYIGNFKNLSSSTKVLLDASTGYYTKHWLPLFLRIKRKEYISEIKYLHLVRDPKERITSLVKFLYHKDSINTEHTNIRYLKIDSEDNLNISLFISYYLMNSNITILTTAKSILDPNNILVVPVQELNINKLYDFCKLDYMSLNLEWMNKSTTQFSTKANEFSNIIFKKLEYYIELEKIYLKILYGITL
jgi:hypothetical protein